jgi:hypothetical protein
MFSSTNQQKADNRFPALREFFFLAFGLFLCKQIECVAVLFLCFSKPKIEASLDECAIGKIRKKAGFVQTIFWPK